ncbi:permease for cytosine/purines, uracil, thiamine, allantoin-domain-containing protein [Lentinula guzmanii]|uniref:Permease for cytosine/purines, uracil, thiamine, allantoin-domain-containing protein n=1 Tax=Lentinula guzmanii TaxID=2804957 RepID=A0AA38MXS9_9AGAR|nr:permease for cytosine/purines, uracil, thiamine, allantoin-domain-containing protein [Lentinula guzmanii]
MAAKWFKPSAWVLEPDQSTLAPTSRWSNKDMDPVPVHLRTWTTWNYVAYWISDAANLPAWELASSMLAIGLNWRQALAAIAVGHTIIAVVMVLNGTVGARLHVGFPILNRSSFGFWFSYFSVISRVILALFWFGIQTYSGSECVDQMIQAIWPSAVRIPNHLSSSAGITTRGMMCYFIYWVIQFPIMLISPQRIRYFFLFKAMIVPAAWLSILIWAMVKVPPSISLANQHASVSGSALVWAWFSSMNSALGNYATLAVNIPDFTRYAKNEQAQYIQAILIPTLFTLTGFVGIAVTSVGQVLYGQTLWDPTTLIAHWDRAPKFFAALSYLIATLGTNISANSLSAANDMMVLFPKYINIRRGQILCAILGGWALAPWEILASAPGFLNFMSGYTIFLGPFAGIMVADYWLVHKCKVDVPAMYDHNGRYRYWHGLNWRVAVALLFSVFPSFPGLISSINPAVDVGKSIHVFDIAWLYGFFTAGSLHWSLSTLFPARETFMESAVMEISESENDTDSASVNSKREV